MPWRGGDRAWPPSPPPARRRLPTPAHAIGVGAAPGVGSRRRLHRVHAVSTRSVTPALARGRMHGGSAGGRAGGVPLASLRRRALGAPAEARSRIEVTAPTDDGPPPRLRPLRPPPRRRGHPDRRHPGDDGPADAGRSRERRPGPATREGAPGGRVPPPLGRPLPPDRPRPLPAPRRHPRPPRTHRRRPRRRRDHPQRARGALPPAAGRRWTASASSSTPTSRWAGPLRRVRLPVAPRSA